jgi:Mg2+/Co2+ transporter CorB
LTEIPTGLLFAALLILVLLSAFFSGSETALMTMNRYRLRHMAQAQHPGALRASNLLARPDRLIGLILLGNNFVNILASALATILALRILGEGGIAIAAGLLTLVILIFAEVAPKTLAALHPERLAFPAAFVYTPMLRVLYPLVWLVNVFANAVLKLLGVSPQQAAAHSLTREELRTVVAEAGRIMAKSHQQMLLSLLDLQTVVVEDIMVPRNEIVGIDIADPLQEIIEQMTTGPYTRMPVYQDSIDYVQGFLHVRTALRLLTAGGITRATLEEAIEEAYFVPEATPLNTLLLNLQRARRRVALVVDEYGIVKGLVTLEDILEEVVGEFTTDPTGGIQEIFPQEDGSYLVDGGASLRDINRVLGSKLPTKGPKTLNGLILEHLETIPDGPASLIVAGHLMDVARVEANSVKLVRLYPRHRKGTIERKRPT